MKEEVFWSRLQSSVSSFCSDISLRSGSENKMICSLVGDELEWCGSHSYLFMATRYMQATSQIQDLEQRTQSAESSYTAELTNSATLRKSLKELGLAAEDRYVKDYLLIDGLFLGLLPYAAVDIS